MSFELRLDGLEGFHKYLREQVVNRKRWRPKMNKFIYEELKVIGNLVARQVYISPDTPVYRDKMRHRTKFKIVGFNKLEMYMKEPEDDQYALAVHDGFFHYKAKRFISGQPFLKQAIYKVVPKYLTHSMKRHWCKQFKYEC